MKKNLLTSVALAVLALATSAAHADDKTLRLLTWGGYAPKEVIEQFTAQIAPRLVGGFLHDEVGQRRNLGIVVANDSVAKFGLEQVVGVLRDGFEIDAEGDEVGG